MTTPPDPNAILLGEPSQGITPAANAEQRALLEWAEAHPIDRPRLPMTKDGNRYSPPILPDGSKGKAVTRCTTFAGTLDDGAGLLKWRHRILARGLLDSLGDDEHLNTDTNDTSTIDRLIGRAFHYGGEKLAADVGTALHLAVEHRIAAHGTGTKAIVPPAPWDADVDAFASMMVAHQLEPVHSECQAWMPVAGGLIGTVDLLVAGPWGDELRVLDLKTGSSCDRIAYAVQLACYASMTHLWGGEAWLDAPPVDRSVAYIAHAPAGTGACELVAVDIAEAAPLIELADGVRNARRKAAVARLFSAVEAPSPPLDAAPDEEVCLPKWRDAPPADVRAWIVERIREVGAADKAALGRAWPDGVATKADEWGMPDVVAIDQALAPLEARHGIQPDFPPMPPPAAPEVDATPAPVDDHPANWPIDEGVKAALDPDLADAISLRFAALDDDRKRLAAVWAADAKRAKRPWAIGRDDLTPRTLRIYLAVVDCLDALWDSGGWQDTDLTMRGALSLVIGEDVQPAWTTGAVIGSLSIDQAVCLSELAVAFRDDDHTASEVGTKVLALAAS